MKRKPLYLRILYGLLVILLWAVLMATLKQFSIHPNGIASVVIAFVMLWVFSLATGCNMGFGGGKTLNHDFPIDNEPAKPPKDKQEMKPLKWSRPDKINMVIAMLLGASVSVFYSDAEFFYGLERLLTRGRTSSFLEAMYYAAFGAWVGWALFYLKKS